MLNYDIQILADLSSHSKLPVDNWGIYWNGYSYSLYWNNEKNFMVCISVWSGLIQCDCKILPHASWQKFLPQIFLSLIKRKLIGSTDDLKEPISVKINLFLHARSQSEHPEKTETSCLFTNFKKTLFRLFSKKKSEH